MNNQRKTIIRIIFLLIFAILPFFCVMLDLFMSTIQPDAEYGDAVVNFDFSIINQLAYFSVWTSTFTSCWGLMSVISHFRKPSNKIPWAESENVLVSVVLYQLASFLIFTVTFLSARGSIIGFNTWYKILKSSLEHWFIPFILFFYFFMFKRQTCTPIKIYALTTAFRNCILPAAYMVFISLRFVMLYTFVPKNIAFTPFPYDEFNPLMHPTLYVIAMLAATILPHPLSIGLELISQKVSNKVPNKWQFESSPHLQHQQSLIYA